MQPSFSDTTALLYRTPAALDALLRDLPESLTRRSEGNGTWTPAEIIGHLIHGERTDWLPRTKLILQHRDTIAFDPFFASCTASNNWGSRLRWHHPNC
jgi:hypothetical protein